MALDPPFEPGDLARQGRVEQAAESRSRRATWARAEAEEETLAALLGRGGEVVLGTPWGQVAGAVTEVGRDHCALGDHRWVALESIETLEPVASGEPADEVDRTLPEVLARLVGTGRPVAVRLRSGTVLSGTVESVGVDVVALRPAAAARTGVVYASSSSVVEVRLEGVGSG